VWALKKVADINNTYEPSGLHLVALQFLLNWDSNVIRRIWLVEQWSVTWYYLQMVRNLVQYREERHICVAIFVWEFSAWWASTVQDISFSQQSTAAYVDIKDQVISVSDTTDISGLMKLQLKWASVIRRNSAGMS
jgi:hypothetical protein